MMITTRPKVLIEIKDGKVGRITSTEDIQFMIIDHDKPKDELAPWQQRQDEMLPEDLLCDKVVELHNMLRPPAF